MATMMDMDKNRKPIVRTTAKEESERMAKEAEAGRAAKADNLKSQKQAYSDFKTGKSFDLTKQGMNVARSVGEKETPAMAPQKTFNQAFKEARAAGKDTFSWNGKKYTTEMAGAKKPSAASEPERETTDYDFGTTNPSEFKRGGKVKMSSASKRADGCCQRGKTRGKMT